MNRSLVKPGTALVAGLLLLHGCGTAQTTTPFGVRTASIQGQDDPDPVLRWNAVAMQCDANDHTGTFGPSQNGGPTRSSRALAIVHAAIYDAVNAIDGSCQPLVSAKSGQAKATGQAALAAAVMQASYDTLSALYSQQKPYIDTAYKKALQGLPDGYEAGMAVGTQAAANILAQRANDGAATSNDLIYPGTADPPKQGQHQPDPLNPDQGLLTPGWGRVQTFSGIDVTAPGVRSPVPPELWNPTYTVAFRDVLQVGADGTTTSTTRTAEQTEIGIFWAYDGTPKLGTPPRMYNQILRKIAKQQRNTVTQNARLFALANIAMADSGVACWDSKFYYNYWRPIIAIRNADAVFNCELINNPSWAPLGAPRSNSLGPNFTPPFPAYPSGHATFAAATFQVLQHFYGTDDIAFRLHSDELRDTTTDNQGNPRPNVVRSFQSFTQAAKECAESRIYLGVHWQFDADAGMDMGRTVADYVCKTLMKPAT